MYPEGDEGGGAGPAQLPRKFGMNLEGFIPLILILVIAVFLAAKFGVINSSTPIIGGLTDFLQPQEKVPVLVLGPSSPELLMELNKYDDLVQVVRRDVPSADRNPKYLLSQYKIVILDQSTASAQGKAVSAKLGEAIEEYVKKGGNLITIMDSGIYQPGAYDVIGWKTSFKDVIPVNCNRIYEGNPSCIQKIVVRGKLYASIDTHPLLGGVDQFPQLMEDNATFETFDVAPEGVEVAYLKDTATQKTYPAIVEKKLIVGKSIYFNYNPGFTSGIFRSTIEYLIGK